VIVTGKGGVGKSVVAAALATRLSATHRVLALDIDPRESLFECLGVEPSAGVRVSANPRLALEHVNPHALIEAFAVSHVRVPWVTRTLTSSRVFHHFVDAAPGLKELALLGHAARVLGHGTRAAVDHVVLDAPASGHALALLDAPRLVAHAIDSGPFASLSGEIARLIADPAHTSILVVTTAEAFAVQESREFTGELEQRLGRRPSAVIVNALYPPYAGGRGSAGADDALAVWRARATTNRRELERFAEWWDGPLCTLPMVTHGRGPALVADLASRLAVAAEVTA
jgi:anion-transporting  ArsA/GET3 family ATPase